MNQMIGFFLLLCSLTAPLFGAPEIHLFSPKNDFTSQKPLILFKGNVQDTTQLLINGHPVELFNNRFYIKVEMQPFQENVFVIEAVNDLGEIASVTRRIKFFPKQQVTQDSNVKITKKQFDFDRHQWVLQGQAYKATSIAVDGQLIPILDDNTFEYRFNLKGAAEHQPFIQVTGINSYRHLFTYTVGLSKQVKPEEIEEQAFFKPLSPLDKANASYKKYKSVILKHYESSRWQPFLLPNSSQELLAQLLHVDDESLTLDHIVFLKQGQHFICLIPFMHPSIDIESVSYQLASVLFKDNSDTVSLLWYNTLPNFVELVYNSMPAYDASYFIMDDMMIDPNTAREEKLLHTFRKYPFTVPNDG